MGSALFIYLFSCESDKIPTGEPYSEAGEKCGQWPAMVPQILASGGLRPRAAEGLGAAMVLRALVGLWGNFPFSNLNQIIGNESLHRIILGVPHQVKAALHYKPAWSSASSHGRNLPIAIVFF